MGAFSWGSLTSQSRFKIVSQEKRFRALGRSTWVPHGCRGSPCGREAGRSRLASSSNLLQIVCVGAGSREGGLMPARAHAHGFDARLPSAAEIENAKHLYRVFAGGLRADAATARLELAAGEDPPVEVVLEPALARAFMQLLRHVGSGRSVSIVATDEQVSIQRAAEILDVPRSYLVKLIEREEIPCAKVGRHRRLRAQDVFAYKKRRDEAREKALSRLAAMDADLL